MSSAAVWHSYFYLYIFFLVSISARALVVKCKATNYSIKLLACSSTAFIPSLLLPSVLLQGFANVLENQRHPQKEGISCAYWSCWKWLKGDLCRERRDCYHCIWFITPCGGGPVAAVRKSRIPGAPSTHRIAARIETESHPAMHEHMLTTQPYLFSWFGEHCCIVKIFHP